jgi:hypothetical protein
MNDPDNFLSRWSRRKSEAGAHAERAEEVKLDTPSGDGDKMPPDNQNSAAPAAEVDVSRLPPIESIGAETDISSFLKPGVPDALRRAALRRAWSADPTIREFMGLTENYWDAAGPDGVPGFGDLDPNIDVKRMVAELFGERPREDTETEAQGVQPVSPASPGKTLQTGPEAGQAEQTKLPTPQSEDRIPHRSINDATQQRQDDSQPRQKFGRRHGGAMPQ